MEKLGVLVVFLSVLFLSTLASAGPGTSTQLNIIFDADKYRTALVDLPNHYDPFKKYPVVIALHGGGGNGDQMRQMTKFNDLGLEEDFITVYPYGHPAVGNNVFLPELQKGQPMIWSAGPCCGEQLQNDVKFLDILINKVIDRYGVDQKRIYMVGHANGGMMAYRYACAHGDRLAGIATNSAAASFKRCISPIKPPPILHLQGGMDKCLPYDGKNCTVCNSKLIGGPIVYGAAACQPVEETMQYLATDYECAGPPVEKESFNDMTCKGWNNCRGGSSITFCSVPRGGHSWPGGDNVPLLCRRKDMQSCREWEPLVSPISDINATGFMWNFLKQQKRP